MALKSTEGRYLKVVRELTEFRPTGVTVYYYEFQSEKDRDEYFNRKDVIGKFINACYAKKLAIEAEVSRKVAELKVEIKSFDDLPDEFKKELKDCGQMMIDADVVGLSWDKSEPLPKFESQKLLDVCGFNVAWREPLSPWAINAINTGAFTNQNFTYECLYRELKKIFKTGFIDC